MDHQEGTMNPPHVGSGRPDRGREICQGGAVGLWPAQWTNHGAALPAWPCLKRDVAPIGAPRRVQQGTKVAGRFELSSRAAHWPAGSGPSLANAAKIEKYWKLPPMLISPFVGQPSSWTDLVLSSPNLSLTSSRPTGPWPS